MAEKVTYEELEKRVQELEKAESELKKMEKALRETEERFRLVLEKLPAGVAVHDLEGRYLIVNDMLCRETGHSKDELLTMSVIDLDPKSGTKDNSTHIWHTLRKGDSISFNSMGVRKDGSEYPIEVHLNGITLDGEPVILAVALDISERKEAEEKLERRLEFERLISEISSEFVGLTPDEIDTGINSALASIANFSGADRAFVQQFQNGNKRVANTHEYCAEGLKPLKENHKSFLIAEEAPWIYKQIISNRVVNLPDVEDLLPEVQLERKHFKSQGTKSFIAVPMKLGDRVIGFLGFDNARHRKDWTNEEEVLLRIVGETFTNALERKHLEMEREKLQAQLFNSIELARLGPWEFDVTSRTFTFNDYFYKLFRTTAEEQGGYKMPDNEYFRRFVHPDDRPPERNDNLPIPPGDIAEDGHQIEHRIIFPDGTTGYISVRDYRVLDDEGNLIKVYGANQDITEQKLAEERLRESEEKLARSRKMESLGLLAGGVAHDLNNVLSGIVSYPELLLLDMPENSKYRKPIQTIQESGDKAVAIVQDLLTISRGVASTREPLNLNDLVRDYLRSPEFKQVERSHPTVTVKTDMEKDLLNTNASPVHLRKVIINLVSNASEAIDGSGSVLISTVNRYLDKPLSGYEDVKTGEYAILSVRDDGSGISSDYLDKIFEPFFTKKMMGRSGTGLGLAVVWNIVQDHDGYIDVKSDENGTIFDLYFPITRDERMDSRQGLSVESLKGKGETILVVDDVESQREISCSMLDILCYRTDSVSSGEEAIEYLKEHPVDLVLLDMIMDPGINGRETYERIIEINPGQKAIIVSGFADMEEVRKVQKLGAGQFVKKPLTLESIGRAIKEELGEGT